MAPGPSGWDEWGTCGLHVKAEVERLNEGQQAMQETLGKIQTNVATLKVKAGVWGATAGMIPVAIMLALWFISK